MWSLGRRTRKRIEVGVAAGSRAFEVSSTLARRQAREQARMWRAKAFFILQCGVAAVVAYSIAHYVFDVAVPLFAPVAAMICLGMTYGQRFRRAIEVTLGVAVGAFVGESFLHIAGLGPWQVGAIVVTAMSVASLLGAGPLMVTQAGVQGLIVALLSGTTTTAFGRWFEALIGACVAVVFAGLVPASTIARPRRKSTAVLETLSSLLTATALGLSARDEEMLEETLTRARATEADLATLRGLTDDAVEVVAISPLHFGRRGEVRELGAMLAPIDRAMRNARVLIRRSATAVRVGEAVPGAYVEAVTELADATDLLARAVREGRPNPALEAALARTALDTRSPAPGAPLSAEVIRAQIRSILVDFHQVLGRSLDDARTRVGGAA